jgi:acyl-homoserine-lactone acylase
MELADRILDDLLAATQQYGSQLAKEAAAVLSAWDRQAEADSQGAVLFAFWAQAMDFGNPLANSSAWAKPWNELDPRNTPDGLANPQAAVATLEAVAGKVKSDYGRLDVPWGEVFRLRYQQTGVDLPASGGSGNLGIFQALYFAPSPDKRFQPILGDTYIAAIEFSKPVRAQVLNTYGNASQPGNSHVGDQLALYARKQLRPVWRTRREIEANLESRQFLKAFD